MGFINDPAQWNANKIPLSIMKNFYITKQHANGFFLYIFTRRLLRECNKC